MQERDDSEQLVRELMRKTKKLQEEQAAAEQSLKVLCIYMSQTHHMAPICKAADMKHQQFQSL